MGIFLPIGRNGRVSQQKNLVMEVKIFADKKIIIRPLSKKDIFRVKDFQDFVNSLVEEKAQILVNKKRSQKEEREWLKAKIKEWQDGKTIFLIAEHNESFPGVGKRAGGGGSLLVQKKIIGTVEVHLGEGHREHVGTLSIAIRNGYRGIGLGSYLMGQILKLAKNCLHPCPVIIRLSAFATNKTALMFYKKVGFKKVADIPRQYYFKGNFIDELIMILFLLNDN